eukprot:jgi/Ulvmu1/1955/UM012_0116.1
MRTYAPRCTATVSGGHVGVVMMGCVWTLACMQDQFQQHIDATHKEMDFFEGYLTDGRKFLISKMFTLADICVAVFLFICMQYGATLERHPELKAFAQRLKERSCFKETWPSAWDDHKNLDWLVEL